MNYLFGRDTAKKESQNGQQYRKAELPNTLSDAIAEKKAAVARAERKGSLPIVLSVVKYICLFVGLTFGTGILKAKVTPAQGYRNAPHLYWIAGVCLLVGGVLWLIDRTRRKHLDEKTCVLEARKQARAAERSADAYLSVPDQTKTVDVLRFDYRTEDGEAVIQSPALLEAYRLYRQDDAVCLTDGACVYAIPRDRLTALRLIEEKTAIYGWNKEGSPNQSKYRKYGLILKKNTPEGLRFCCALEWTDGGEVWQLRFPAYELSKMEEATGLRGPELPEIHSEKRTPAPGRKDREKLRPQFYWTVPKEAKIGAWFSPLSDLEFRMEHPRIYTILAIFGALLLFLPCFAFLFAAVKYIPGASKTPLLLLGCAGGFVTGVGLFNILAAWLRQYLGHWVTIVCLILGGGVMAASWLLML